MSPIENSMMRDRVLDVLAECCPVALQDDVALEGIFYMVMVEVRRARGEERQRLLEQLAFPN